MVSTFIESTTDQEFSIYIRPRLPWNFAESGGAEDAVIVDNEKYSLLAEVFFDEREEPEDRSIVYLDPFHRGAHIDCSMWIRNRWERTEDGRLLKYHFVFQERGIERILGGLNINTEAAQQDGDNALSQSLDLANLSGKYDTLSEPKPGKIMIRLTCIQTTRRWLDPEFYSRSRSKQELDEDLYGSDKSLIHTARSVSTGVTSDHVAKVVGWHYYKQEKIPYATFIFNYRSRQQLARMSLQGFPYSTADLKPQGRQLRSAMPHGTPLGLQERQALLSSEKVKPSETFEEKVEKGFFKPYDSAELPASQEYRTAEKEKKKKKYTTDKNNRGSEESAVRNSNAGKNTTDSDDLMHSAGERRRSERLRTKANHPADPTTLQNEYQHLSSPQYREPPQTRSKTHSSRNAREDAESEGDEDPVQDDHPSEPCIADDDTTAHAEDVDENTDDHRQLRSGMKKMALGKRSHQNFDEGQESKALYLELPEDRELALTDQEHGLDGMAESAGFEGVAEKRFKTTEAQVQMNPQI